MIKIQIWCFLFAGLMLKISHDPAAAQAVHHSHIFTSFHIIYSHHVTICHISIIQHQPTSGTWQWRPRWRGQLLHELLRHLLSQLLQDLDLHHYDDHRFSEALWWSHQRSNSSQNQMELSNEVTIISWWNLISNWVHITEIHIGVLFFLKS